MQTTPTEKPPTETTPAQTRSESSKPEIYVSIDVEFDGQIPGRNSMLSFGAAAFTLASHTPIATFEANLQTLEGAVADEDTMAWWRTQPIAWAQCREEPLLDPKTAMEAFATWVERLPGKPVPVGYPIACDSMWVRWYLVSFTDRDPLGFSGIDIATQAATLMGVPYGKAKKAHMPAKWFYGCGPHTHRALQDAISQGILFVNIARSSQGLSPLIETP